MVRRLDISPGNTTSDWQFALGSEIFQALSTLERLGTCHVRL
jgi:hypothetical protein